VLLGDGVLGLGAVVLGGGLGGTCGDRDDGDGENECSETAALDEGAERGVHTPVIGSYARIRDPRGSSVAR
jgi:hypothetical protein